jgi:hypothetical protein
MQDLIAVGFSGTHRAAEVLRQMQSLDARGNIELADAVASSNGDGPARRPVSRREQGSAALGGLVGAIWGRDRAPLTAGASCCHGDRGECQHAQLQVQRLVAENARRSESEVQCAGVRTAVVAWCGRKFGRRAQCGRRRSSRHRQALQGYGGRSTHTLSSEGGAVQRRSPREGAAGRCDPPLPRGLGPCSGVAAQPQTRRMIVRVASR